MLFVSAGGTLPGAGGLEQHRFGEIAADELHPRAAARLKTFEAWQRNNNKDAQAWADAKESIGGQMTAELAAFDKWSAEAAAASCKNTTLPSARQRNELVGVKATGMFETVSTRCCSYQNRRTRKRTTPFRVCA